MCSSDLLRPLTTSVHLQEAFMVRHHPQWLAAREAQRSGAIGSLVYAQMPFSYFNADPFNIRNITDTGGGALYDIGCYAIAAGRWFFEAEPARVACLIDRDPTMATDRCASGIFDFGAGRQMTFTVATQASRFQRLTLVGSSGRIEIEIPVNAPPDQACRWLLSNGQGERWHSEAEVDQYTLQGDAFARLVAEEAPNAAGLDQAQAQMRVIDALFAAAQSGRFEAV